MCKDQESIHQVPNLTQDTQGRRRLLESGTAFERRRRSPSAEGTCGGEHERGYNPLSLGGLGDLPHENFVIEDN